MLRFHPDPVIFVCAFMLLVIGLAVIASVMPHLFWSQLVFAIFGLAAFLVVSGIDYRLYLPFSRLIYVFSVLALLGTTLVGIVSRGAARWVEVAGFRFQFSELLKPFLVIFLASIFTSKMNGVVRAALAGLLFLPVLLLIFKQPDLGSTIVYGLAFLAMLLASGISRRIILMFLLFFIVSLPGLWQILADYQRLRITSFLNPGHDVLGSSYNAVQAIITVGSGMIFGRGLGRGTQSHLLFLPERHTDFIFASFAEEFGFLGAAVLLAVYFILFWRLLLAFSRCQDLTGRLIVIGIIFIIYSQMLINIGMNIGLLPITGITLPLVSYGGSSLLGTMIALGIVANISHQHPG